MGGRTEFKQRGEGGGDEGDEMTDEKRRENKIVERVSVRESEDYKRGTKGRLSVSSEARRNGRLTDSLTD